MNESSLECVLEAGALLGEGTCWDSESRRLIWVDIESRRVCRLDPDSGSNESWTMASEASFAVPSQRGDLIVGTRNGIFRLNPKIGQSEMIWDPENDKPGNRFNDGKCDARGRLWAGTISDARNPEAALYFMDPQSRPRKMLDGVTNSNGLIWSLDESRFFYIDTATRRVDVFDFDPDRATIENRRTAIRIPDEMGKPDGMTIDSEGMLWIALWGGGAVSRWNPETGDCLGKAAIPAERVTNCCFGGQGLDELYITTARTGLDDEALKKQPQAGGVFRLRPGVAGVPSVPFQG